VERKSAIIIGGGLGGLIAAIKLKESGRNFTLIEKNPKVGGTWYDNRYPGCACDVPVALYQLSFAPSVLWSRIYPQAHEVQAYAEELVQRYQLTPHIRLGTAAETVEWVAASKTWRATTSTGKTVEGDILIGALGQLNRPAWPDIPGIETFKGAAMHTARWDDTVSWAGKRVGVVGSAASAVQAIPELAKTAAHLTVFQRTPNWMIPRNDQPVTDEFKTLMMSNLEAAAKVQDLNRNLIFEHADGLTWHAFSFTDEGRAALTRQALDHLHDQVSDPELRAKLTPDYPVGCKRILICDDFYPTLQLPHVSLETDPIARVTPEGVEMKSGTHHAFDILVFATGFNTSDWRWSVDVQGPNETLNEAWSGGAEAHRGVTVAGFPNFFVLYGPNTNLGRNSITYMLEAQVGYVIDALDRMETGGLVTLQPRADIQSRYNDALQKELAETVWGDPACGQSWYKAADGKITQNWSRPAREFKEMLYELRLEEFETA